MYTISLLLVLMSVLLIMVILNVQNGVNHTNEVERLALAAALAPNGSKEQRCIIDRIKILEGLDPPKC